MSSFEIDASEVAKLEDAFDKAGALLLPAAKAVVAKGSLNIKKDWKARWSGFAHAPALPHAVTYDTKSGADVIESEIGPDKGRAQGALGNLLEFGSENNAPIPGGLPALSAEEPRFVRASEEMVADVLEKLL